MNELFYVIDEDGDSASYPTLDAAVSGAVEIAIGGLEVVVCKAVRKFVPMAQEVAVEEPFA